MDPMRSVRSNGRLAPSPRSALKTMKNFKILRH